MFRALLNVKCHPGSVFLIALRSRKRAGGGQEQWGLTSARNDARRSRVVVQVGATVQVGVVEGEFRVQRRVGEGGFTNSDGVCSPGRGNTKLQGKMAHTVYGWCTRKVGAV